MRAILNGPVSPVTGITFPGFHGLMLAGAAVMLVTAFCDGSLSARTKEERSPAYSRAGELLRPADYREWVYVTSGLGMTYGTGQPVTGTPPSFDNVFVTREAYRGFLSSGT